MAGRSRPKNGVASARLCPAIHGLLISDCKDVDARDKPAHDGTTFYLAGYVYNRSTIVTLAMPPPSHMVCKP
jgi:hypothetical protein